MTYGVHDTLDDLWIGLGVNAPPLEFETLEDARTVCEMIAERFGYPPGRLSPERMPGVNKIRDHVTAGPKLRLVTGD